jgi:hypothetical protein
MPPGGATRFGHLSEVSSSDAIGPGQRRLADHFASRFEIIDLSGLVGMAFVTRSAESVLAPLLQKLEAFGLHQSTTSLALAHTVARSMTVGIFRPPPW